MFGKDVYPGNYPASYLISNYTRHKKDRNASHPSALVDSAVRRIVAIQ